MTWNKSNGVKWNEQSWELARHLYDMEKDQKEATYTAITLAACMGAMAVRSGNCTKGQVLSAFREILNVTVDKEVR